MEPRTTPQNITDSPNSNTLFSVWKFRKGADYKPVFETVCGLIGNLNRSMAIRVVNAGASCVMGIGHDAWLKLGLPTPLPKELTTFKPIAGRKHVAVSTPGDLHFHLRASSTAVCFDMAKALSNALSPVAECLEEIHGFRYWDGRSVIGFVDGTENPVGDERSQFGLVGDEDPAYRGGSYLFVQKYLHNLTAWEALPVEAQEKIIGRYKQSDVEMPDDVKPSNAHSALANLTDDDGNDLKIVRDNMPFGHPQKGEFGTYFIAYANTFSTTRKMLERMFLGVPEGNYDRLLDFSTAHTGTLFFVPTMEMLDGFSEG